MPKFMVRIDQERCKGCGLCVEFCPQKVLKLSSSFNSKSYHPAMVEIPEKCKGCAICAREMCPEAAIEIFKRTRSKAKAFRRARHNASKAGFGRVKKSTESKEASK